MNKKLVLFTGGFPYGSGETCLETELPYLCEAFEDVILVASNNGSAQKREVPQNCEVRRIDLSYSTSMRLRSLKGIFSSIFREELSVIKSVYQRSITKGIQSTALVSLKRGRSVADYLLKYFSEQLNDTVFYSYWCDDAALGIALAHSKNDAVKGICRIHRWDVYFEESAVNYLPYRHFIANHLKKIYSISRNGIDYAVERWKVDRLHFEISRLGIDNDHGPIQPKEDGVFRIVSCSNIIPVKRVGLIADALKEITNHPVEWTHIGDGPLRRELEDKVKLLPENIVVNFVGRLPNKEVYELYESICPDLFINVSSSEGVPVSIMEAMSYGIPVLATDVGGNGEIVNEENGVLIGGEVSSHEIANELKQLLSKGVLNVKSTNAYKMWSEYYSAEKNYRYFTSLLKVNGGE